jgi:hypothetical protein
MLPTGIQRCAIQPIGEWILKQRQDGTAIYLEWRRIVRVGEIVYQNEEVQEDPRIAGLAPFLKKKKRLSA